MITLEVKTMTEGKIDGTRRRQYFISHLGSPVMPVNGHVYVMRRAVFSELRSG